MAEGIQVVQGGHLIIGDPATLENEPAAVAQTPGRSSKGRDVGIDRLRGLCLVSISVGHLAKAGGGGSPLDAAVHAMAWVSGAAGFVFLSGVSVGLLWARRTDESNRMVDLWALGRSAVLIAVVLAVNGFGIAWFELVGRPSWYPSADPTVVTVLTGQWSLPFADVLWMYGVFLACVAFARRTIQSSPGFALGVSVALYAASLLVPPFGPSNGPGEAAAWDLLAWQMVFVTGLVAAGRWSTVRETLERHRSGVLRLGLVGLVAIGALRFGFNLAERGIDPFGVAPVRSSLESYWLVKSSLGPFRVLLIALIGPAAALLTRNQLPILGTAFDRLLIGAGGRSLRVYLVSTVLAFVWTVLPTEAWSVPVTDLAIAAGTAAVLAVGMPRAVGRGRPWSI